MTDETHGVPTEAQLLGRALRALRNSAGMTQAEAAEAYGVEPNSWRRYEAGERELKFEQLKALAEAVGSTREDLLAERDRLALGGHPRPRSVAANEDARPFLGPQSRAGARRQTVFLLAEGDAVITLPAVLSEESRKELADYLAILMRRIERSG